MSQKFPLSVELILIGGRDYGFIVEKAGYKILSEMLNIH
jgi:hypothetical protein